MVATIHSTLGMLFHAVVIGAALYGAGCLQGYLYYRRHKGKDGWMLQSLVGFILLCDTFQMGILTVYQYTITLQSISPSESTHVCCDVRTLDESRQPRHTGYHVQRRYSFGGSIVLLLENLAMVFGLVELGFVRFVFISIQLCSCWCIAEWLAPHYPRLQYSTYAELTQLKNISMSCNILAASSDIFISLAMVFYLQTSKTGYRKSNSMINRLIIFTFNTGIPVSVCALFACISINVWPDTFLYMFFFLLQGRFTLNSREYIRGTGFNNNNFTMNSYPVRQTVGGSTNGFGIGLGTNVDELNTGIGVEFRHGTTLDHHDQESSVYGGQKKTRTREEGGGAGGGGIAIRIDTTKRLDTDGTSDHHEFPPDLKDSDSELASAV
ncbi:hypothetical protein K435DRAFT_797469 [Dendrothele bispora CBS 962.96]|uniref:DUF6534 domain-containing protein n=1 Tax=Dendrothele bispora (strain CBS 962.96) TaxID=1314807 RepID=A0A4S8M2A5_DENBC|nr:hypothetical protein K435DRAFT_797469 [Dendrothele bispora CBS 962.96]